jgi:predicted SAM-dependent methyltransferase
MIRVNAGSGQRCFDRTQGWINLDSQPKRHLSVGDDQYPDMIADMRHMPFPDGSVDMVVSHHTIEHLGCGEADAFIKEAWRVLRPGGSLIVAIPDIKALARRWLLGQITDWIFIINMMGAYQGEEADRHRWHYTWESLTKLIQDNGAWSSVGAWDQTPVPGADISVDWWILIMCATKR